MPTNIVKPEDFEFRSLEAIANERLDIALAQGLELSRSYAKNLVLEGYVQIDGKPVIKAAYKLKGTEILTVMLPPARPLTVEAEDVELELIYQDQYLACIDKPAGMVAHPTASVRSGTVVNALLGKMPLAKDDLFHPDEEDYRPGIVHRLDKETSGVMVVAKTAEAHRELAAAFKKRLTEKVYLALTVGKLEPEIYVDAPIGRHPNQRHKMGINGSNAKNAQTRFWVIAELEHATLGIISLLRAKPHTGRTHQIRVHLQHLGAPILGDTVYGRASQYISRQALHAQRLTLPHPYDKQAITFAAHIPEDIRQAWLNLGGNRQTLQQLEL